MSGIMVLKVHRTNKLLPAGYKLDHDPDVGILRRSEGSVVSYFPIWSLVPTRVLEAAQADLARCGNLWQR
jgi:hypothetical protein